MTDTGNKVSWEELSGDDQDYFRNPHVHPTTRADYRAPGFSDAERVIAVIDRLNAQGARKALEELDTAIGNLDRYNRPYPRTLVTEMREALSARAKDATDTK